MPIVRITRPPMVTAEVYDKVNEQLRIDADPPEGLIVHTAGALGGQWQIIDVWESEEQAERFGRERLGPAVEAVMGGAPPVEPDSVTYELHRIIRP